MPLNFHENKVALFDMCPRDLLKNSSSEDGLFIGTHLCSLPVILLRRKKDRLVLRIRLFMYFAFCIFQHDGTFAKLKSTLQLCKTRLPASTLRIINRQS